jgi:hypothetical protein
VDSFLTARGILISRWIDCQIGGLVLGHVCQPTAALSTSAAKDGPAVEMTEREQQQQIPSGNDRKKSKSSECGTWRVSESANCRSLHSGGVSTPPAVEMTGLLVDEREL